MIWPGSAFLRKTSEDLRASYWFAPAAMVLCALLAAVAAEALDRHELTAWIPQPFYGTTADAARAVLTVIASAAIGAAGVMFSMTMVAVSFASANVGPRLIRNFMQDRGVQISLGMLMSTFVFALVVLRGIERNDSLVPALSLTCALALALLSVAVMIYFIHHIPELISLENITSALGRRLLVAIDRMPRAEMSGTNGASASDLPSTPVYLADTGYLQAVNAQSLSRIAAEPDLTLRVLRWPGDFVAPHLPVAEILSENAPAQALTDEVADCFALGTSRTEAQNPAFIAKQLTEIIARALSPGINDPFTAITCLNWLHAALHALAAKGPVDPLENEGLEDADPFGFLDVLRVAHRMPRGYLAADPMSAPHACDLLAKLAAALPPGPRRLAVQNELAALTREAQARQPANAQIAALPAPEDMGAAPPG